VLGLIENMSTFVCDGCGKEHAIFSRGGGRQAAAKLEVPFLGELPIVTGIRESCDEGVPIVISHPDSPAARAFAQIVDRIVEEVARRAVEAGPPGSKLRLVE
jgi:ATP-binding protein involved in chromosome partitioning